MFVIIFSPFPLPLKKKKNSFHQGRLESRQFGKMSTRSSRFALGPYSCTNIHQERSPSCPKDISVHLEAFQNNIDSDYLTLSQTTNFRLFRTEIYSLQTTISNLMKVAENS